MGQNLRAQHHLPWEEPNPSLLLIPHTFAHHEFQFPDSMVLCSRGFCTHPCWHLDHTPTLQSDLDLSKLALNHWPIDLLSTRVAHSFLGGCGSPLCPQHRLSEDLNPVARITPPCRYQKGVGDALLDRVLGLTTQSWTSSGVSWTPTGHPGFLLKTNLSCLMHHPLCLTEIVLQNHA